MSKGYDVLVLGAGNAGGGDAGRRQVGRGGRILGRSRGGLTGKIDALVDVEGRPIDIVLAPGSAMTAKRHPTSRRLRSRTPASWPRRPTSRQNATGRRPSPSASGPTDTATRPGAS